MKTFLFEIISPERRVFSEEVVMVSLPTLNGQIGVLAHHIPLFTAVTEGEVKIETKDREYFLAIGEGFMEISKDRAVLLVSRAYKSDELNEKEIEKAHQAAKDALKNKTQGIERAQAMAILRRSMIEFKVARRSPRKSRPLPS